MNTPFVRVLPGRLILEQGQEKVLSEGWIGV